MNLSQVEDDRDSNTVQCCTDLLTCCHIVNGSHIGDYFAPGSDTRLPFYFEDGVEPDIYESRRSQVVYICCRNNLTGPSGIYRCVIANNDVHNDSDRSVGETVYVGLYKNGGVC